MRDGVQNTHVQRSDLELGRVQLFVEGTSFTTAEVMGREAGVDRRTLLGAVVE